MSDPVPHVPAISNLPSGRTRRTLPASFELDETSISFCPANNPSTFCVACAIDAQAASETRIHVVKRCIAHLLLFIRIGEPPEHACLCTSIREPARQTDIAPATGRTRASILGQSSFGAEGWR